LQLRSSFGDDQRKEWQGLCLDVDLELEAIGEQRLQHQPELTGTIIAGQLLHLGIVVVVDFGVDVPAAIEQWIGASNKLGAGRGAGRNADDAAKSEVLNAIAGVVPPDLFTMGVADVAIVGLDGCDFEGCHGFAILWPDELGADRCAGKERGEEKSGDAPA
jgi:hypothetical protein